MRAGVVVLVLATAAAAQDLSSYLHESANKQLSARRETVARIVTKEQAVERQTYVKRQLLALMGAMPAERTPLNIRKAGTIDRGTYRIEKIIYESQPKFYVTANLYVPQKGNPPYPAVLQPVGHSVSAKARAFYQKLGLGLVQQGFVVLTYDPTGQGERRIFWDERLGDSLVGGTTTEHEMVGIQSLLGGVSIARDMVWDGMRSVDVLQSLAYVDANRIGVSGCSGGGTLTSYIAALDERVKAAAPSCYITDWEDQLEGTGPQDAEQQFPDQLKAGLNHADLVEAFAPKPYLIASTTEDFFPIAGARKAFEESRRFYELFGAQDRVATAIDSGGHGTTQKQREAIYAWMSRWLKGTNGDVLPEPPLETEYEETMLCTPTGQLATSLGGATASTLSMARLAALTSKRPRAGDLKKQIASYTRYELSQTPLDIRDSGGGSITYEAAPGRSVSALLLSPGPDVARKTAVVVIEERGRPVSPADADIQELTRLGHPVLAIVPSGFVTTPKAPSYSETWFGDNKTPWLALMVGKTSVGIHMEDIIRGIDVLSERGLLPDGSCLVYGRGPGASVDALHVAAVDTRVAGVAVQGGLVSLGAIAQAPLHRRLFKVVIPGVLAAYDLPDLAASIAPRQVVLANSESPVGRVLTRRDVNKEYGSAAIATVRREEEALASAFPLFR